MMKQAIELLEFCGQSSWVEWFKQDIKALEQNRFYPGIDHFLSAFHGMGSLNDSLLYCVPGPNVSENQANEVNRKLRKILLDAYVLAATLRRERISGL